MNPKGQAATHLIFLKEDQWGGPSHLQPEDPLPQLRKFSVASSALLEFLLTSLSGQLLSHVFISFSYAVRLGNFFENCFCSGKFRSAWPFLMSILYHFALVFTHFEPCLSQHPHCCSVGEGPGAAPHSLCGCLVVAAPRGTLSHFRSHFPASWVGQGLSGVPLPAPVGLPGPAQLTRDKVLNLFHLGPRDLDISS